jgi:predicted nicotinamide N-methyase
MGVGPLAWTTPEQALRQRFEPSGTVDTVRMLTDRATDRSRGCGFIAVAGRGDTAALPLHVTLARRRRDGGGIPWDAAGYETGPLHTKEEYMPADRQRRTPPPERSVWGLTILSPSHPEVRRLQQAAVQPTLHGHKVRPTSLVLLDYLHQRGLPPQTRVLELGCGWGLVGIACAKMFQAQVTGLDADAAVFPYLQLHAARNGVHLATRQGTFADLTPQDLAAFDLIVGADICFWEDLVAPLYQLVRHGVAAGVAEILIADPSRPPFDELCARCVAQGDAEVFTWTMTTPVADTGRILRVVGRDAPVITPAGRWIAPGPERLSPP